MGLASEKELYKFQTDSYRDPIYLLNKWDEANFLYFCNNMTQKQVHKLIRVFLMLLVILAPAAHAQQVYEVDGTPGYNCWPMIQPVGDRIVCIYTIGKAHNPWEKGRAAYARYSDDGARSWSEKNLIDCNADYGTSSIGNGTDSQGNALFWIRRLDTDFRMALYRTSDGKHFQLLSTPYLNPKPMQITDIFHTPEGMACLWFSDDYSHERANKSWGILISKHDGQTWEQRVIESGLRIDEWPTEPSVVVYGDGRLLAIARSEGGTGNQFQLTSTDWGKTWSKHRTNISDVLESTPTLILDKKSDQIYNYYYQRGPGLLKLRTADAQHIFSAPQAWNEAQVIAQGGTQRPYDSGNANAVAYKDKHYITYYSGDSINCKVVVAVSKYINK